MSRWIAVPVAAVALSACVTINVYFPAAEAREAAKEFVEKVISEDEARGGAPGGSAALPAPALERAVLLARRVDWLGMAGIGAAHAQSAADFNIRTPAILAIQARMEQRFESQLRAHFDSGALGFTEDGLVVVRDASAVALKDRVAVNSAVADENRDRKAVYREIAVANNHPEWEAQIRGVFAKQWVDSARSGWWYQRGGAWRQK